MTDKTMVEYQDEASEFALYPEEMGLPYVALGLTGEAGEFADKVKKIIRGDHELTDEVREELWKELGDVLWYVSQAARELDICMGCLAQQNIDKLQSRMDRGVTKGSGDNR